MRHPHDFMVGSWEVTTYMTPEQRQKAVEKIVEFLPSYEFADELLIDAVRTGVGSKEWVESSPETRTNLKREVYAHLKAVAGVKLLDDRLTREDLDELDQAIVHLRAAGKICSEPHVADEMANARVHIENAKKR